jgi:transcriptional regulator with XRE-family HTH domain
LVQTTQQHYSLIEKGERRPSPRLAKRIAALLEFEWVKFYEDDETSATKETA